MSTLFVRDETAAGQALREFSLDFLTERITVRELIRSRVYQEVKDYNVRAAAANPPDGSQKGAGDTVARGLVQPRTLKTEASAARRSQAAREINWQEQCDVALKAFTQAGFLVFVGEQQAKSLDEEIEIRPGTTVSFVKLVPLVGG